ncbi:hypothetical protein [Paenarthrobacter sp. YJN-5]|uniref:hypothetical protein n=1 Tax=Paenarthrobacter sp. YJN-5 TaxID=2735316 RepID=UPI001878727A|nr:hypothetical protein [Paenarthrobacter sp. YJN-5]QOT19658.1 hypothetical protein HMI59_23895 [Paenarthrobacter sp. YJN-5]
MNLYTLFPGDTLLVIAIAAFIIGGGLLLSLFLRAGARRQDPALASILNQVASAPSGPLRESYIADIVDAPSSAGPRALTR